MAETQASSDSSWSMDGSCESDESTCTANVASMIRSGFSAAKTASSIGPPNKSGSTPIPASEGCSGEAVSRARRQRRQQHCPNGFKITGPTPGVMDGGGWDASSAAAGGVPGVAGGPTLRRRMRFAFGLFLS